MSESIHSTHSIEASAAAVFAVLTQPDQHPDTDPTDWVRDAIDDDELTAVGQVFGMHMFHPARGGDYEMWNTVTAFETDRTIGWKPGIRDDEGEVRPGGHLWRYDLEEAGGVTTVTLTYDWTEMPQAIRDSIGQMPPFAPSYLAESLEALDHAVTA